MQKTKLKIGLFIVLSIVGLAIGFFFAGYLNLLLTGSSPDDISALSVPAIISSLQSDERHRMLLLCIEIVILAGVAVITLMNRRETFESDTSAIAGTMQTPVPIGQGQHGTARWLKQAERKKVFAFYRLEQSNKLFTALLHEGTQDRMEVEKYANRGNGSTEDAGIADAENGAELGVSQRVESENTETEASAQKE